MKLKDLFKKKETGKVVVIKELKKNQLDEVIGGADATTATSLMQHEATHVVQQR